MDMQKLLGVTLLTLVLFSGSSFAATPVFGSPQPVYPKSFQGITPSQYPGNFKGSDDNQVCYDMAAQGLLVGPVTGELRGFKLIHP